jgi:hypothetical protein
MYCTALEDMYAQALLHGSLHRFFSSFFPSFPGLYIVPPGYNDRIRAISTRAASTFAFSKAAVITPAHKLPCLMALSSFFLNRFFTHFLTNFSHDS